MPLDSGLDASSSRCVYWMGENFLHELSNAIGNEPVRSVLREAYLSDGWRGEEALYNTLLEHTPPDKQESLLEVYR